MTRRADARPAIEGGLNSMVEWGGKNFHVQTQCSRRDSPVVESIVFQGGQTLIRITARYDDIASPRGFSRDDAQHVLEMQHANLIQKIRHGLMRDDKAPDSSPANHEVARLIDSNGVVVDPAEVDDPSVVELLQELGVAIDNVIPDRPAHTPGPPNPTLAPTSTSARIPPRVAPLKARPWWRRLAIVVRPSFRGRSR